MFFDAPWTRPETRFCRDIDAPDLSQPARVHPSTPAAVTALEDEETVLPRCIQRLSMSDALATSALAVAHPQPERQQPASPVLKWAGGKTRLMKELVSRLPERWTGYYEPVVGGGGRCVALGAPRRLAVSHADDAGCSGGCRRGRALSGDLRRPL